MRMGLNHVRLGLALGALLLAACSRSVMIEHTCPRAPTAAVEISCGKSVELAVRFADQKGLSAEAAKVEFIGSFGVAEGTGVPAWIVTLDTASGSYEVVLTTSDGRVIAHTT